jgi:acyl-CoA thioester hydrolase
MNELLDDFAVVVDIKVEWGDMDALQHVNNIEYFKYFQMARISYFEKIDADGLLGDKRISSILASTQCKFIYPLAFPDQITVGIRVESLARQHFIMKYAVISQKHNRLAALGDGKIVMFDYIKNIKADIPDGIRSAIIDLEKTEVEIIN